jgi:hypothetical protein
MFNHSDIMRTKRVFVITGHYGSGKTEISLNLAMAMRQKSLGDAPVGLIDLDIANPYFRSREMQARLQGAGIDLIGSSFGHDITAELPALSPEIHRPLDDKRYRCVVDVGGNDSGARVLNQFGEKLKSHDVGVLAVVNVFRPETDNIDKIRAMIASIEAETGLLVQGIINNSNLLRQTQPADLEYGIDLAEQASFAMGIPIVANCCEAAMTPKIKRMPQCAIMPMQIYMRPAWLDM